MRSKILFVLKNPFWVLKYLITEYIPYFRFIRDTRHYQCCISIGFWFNQKILNLGGNSHVYWPVHPTSKIVCANRILVGIDAYPGIMGGCYIQGIGGIEIGDYTQIAPNVVIVSANHDLYDSRRHKQGKVRIGKYCWIGAGSKIMPGVILGDFTIVGAGAVVTKSFSEGYCVIGGVPAKKIKELDIDKCVFYDLVPKYNGYIPAYLFQKYRKKYLEV